MRWIASRGRAYCNPVDEEALLASLRDAFTIYRERLESIQRKADIQRAVEQLTARELEVMQHVIAGMINRQIGVELGIAEKTVKIHRARIMEKMGASSVVDLVRYCEIVGIQARPFGEELS